MAELRYNPVSMEWVMVASHRQKRPQMPQGWCPFCPGSGRVPDGGYTTLRYQNDFPALSTSPPQPDDVSGLFFRTRPAYGRCEVLLYSDAHDATLAGLPDAQAHELASMWRDCYADMAADPGIEYVFIFENKGEVVGVTMPHPHGQAYGYSFIPKKVESELIGAVAFCDKHGGACLHCALLSEELRDGRRVIFENDHFVAFVPFFSPITYGAHVMAKRHVPHLAAMDSAELRALGETLRDCAGMYDAVFGAPFPYMMCMFNAPTPAAQNSLRNLRGALCSLSPFDALGAFGSASPLDIVSPFDALGAFGPPSPSDLSNSFDAYCHFHVKFFPPMRTPDTQQFFASSETGAGAWCNPNCPEEKAAELRAAYRRFKA